MRKPSSNASKLTKTRNRHPAHGVVVGVVVKDVVDVVVVEVNAVAVVLEEVVDEVIKTIMTMTTAIESPQDGESPINAQGLVAVLNIGVGLADSGQTIRLRTTILEQITRHMSHRVSVNLDKIDNKMTNKSMEEMRDLA